MRMRTIIGLSLGFVLTLVLVGVLPLRAQDGPSFIIVQPQAAQKITGTALPIVIEFSCEEDAPVVRFESYLDSASLRWGRIRQPIARGHFRVEADLNEISVKPGPHTLYVKLYDSKGRVTQREQRIILEAPNTVRADSTPPRVRIVSPRDGQVISGKTDIKVDAVDDESGVKWVMVFINNKMRAYMNEAPYVLPWNPLDDKELLSAYVIRARAMDFFDNEGASLPVTVKLVQERTLIDDGAALQHPPADPVDAVIFPVTKLPTPSLGPGAEKWTSNLLRPAAALPGLSGELPLAQGFDRGGLPAETGALAVAVLPVKTLPGLAMTDALAHADARGVTVPAALAARPGLARPPVGAARPAAPSELPLPAARPAATRTLPDGAALVAMLPGAAKQVPGAPERARAATLTADTTRAVALVNPGASARPGVHTPSAGAPASGHLAVPATPAARAQGRLPAVTLVALAPAAPAKRHPGAGADAGDLHLRAVAMTTPARLREADDGARPAMGVAAAPGVRTLPDARALETVGARGTLTDLPVVVALLPAGGKPTPALTTLTAIATAPGVYARGPNPRDTMPAARGGDPARPALALAADVANPAALHDAHPRDRRVTPEPAPVTLAAQPGKLAPAAQAKPAAGMQLTPAYPVAPVAPTSGGTAPVPAPPGAPRAEQPTADVVMDLEQHHTVKGGQTLVEIARVYATTPEELLKRNPGISPERPLPEGVALVVPGATARIYVDDTPLTDVPNPFIAQGHTMVPIRHIVEAKGGVVVWLPATREVNAWADNTFMGLKVGDTSARINGDSYTLPVAPAIRQARTMVPLRYLMTALRLQVTYNPQTGTYLLVSQQEK